MIRFQIGLLFASLGVSLTAHGVEQAQDCAAIADPGDRLACFDSFFPASGDPNEAPELSRIEIRQQLEEESERNWFSLTPHKPNYVLPIAHNFSSDYSRYGELGESFKDSELKFQLSLKTRLWPNMWRESSLWFAYTQTSYWQYYAPRESSQPFRETNHEPELIWEFPLNFKLFGMDARVGQLALNHQSNGQVTELSRSWNRVTGELVLERGRWATSIKSWVRTDSDEFDENPNIKDYMGRLQLGAIYRGDRHSLSLGLKNNLSSPNRSGVELNWMFPLGGHLRGFVQAYSGYGENMIDMENYNNRIGIGIALNDWL